MTMDPINLTRLDMVYYHGGPPGLREIRPPNVTGAPASDIYASYAAAGSEYRRDMVYMAAHPETAMIYAALHFSDRGVVYRVRPIGQVLSDPDWRGPLGGSVMAAGAVVLGIVPVKRKMLFKLRKALISEHHERI